MKDRIMDTMLELVAVPGIAGTESENLTAEKIMEILKRIPYFKANGEYLNMIEIQGDPLKRKFIAALFRSKTENPGTVILTGHFDVVGVEEFGKLKDIAFNPEEYTKRISELGLDEDSLKDLNSGDWIFGRGTADMKYGLALHLELLRQFCENGDFAGNILFLAVPGEESNSEGMLEAVPYLLNLKKKYNLSYEALLLSECCMPEEVGDNKKRIYIGSCGKVMPLFFFAGKESHVCDSLSSINSNLLASELNRLLEVNAELCEGYNRNITPPPVCLKQKDLKELYSVQTPIFSAAYYNMITLTSTVDELMAKLKKISVEAFRNTVDIINRNVDKYCTEFGVNIEKNTTEPLVMSFEELIGEVTLEYGDALDNILKDKINIWKTEKLDIQEMAINIIREVYQLSSRKQPMIIIGFAPPYYPHKHLGENCEKDKRLLKIVDEVCRYASEKHNTELHIKDYFMGISDLSYTGINGDSYNELEFGNLVGLGSTYKLPLKELSELEIPSIIFGGFGKDYHKYTERLNLSYSMEIVPELYTLMLEKIFKVDIF